MEKVNGVAKIISDGIRRELVLSGVPARFHDKSLTDYNTDIRDMFHKDTPDSPSEIDAMIATGTGMTLSSKDNKSLELMYMIARAMYLSGYTVKVVDILELQFLLSKEDTRQQMYDVDCLMVVDFYQNPNFQILQPNELYFVESFLLHRVNNIKSVFIQYYKDGTKPTDTSFWGKRLVSTLESSNTEITLK